MLHLFNNPQTIEQALQAFASKNCYENAEKTTYEPAIDLFEKTEGYEYKLDLPGMTRDQIKLTYENGILAIAGERKAPELPENARGRFERWSGEFVRRFRLPKDADASRIEAALKDGVLSLCVPKLEAARPRTITIQG